MQNSFKTSAKTDVGLAQNDVMTFNSAEFGNVRIVIIDGEPWFVGKDVAKSLEYRNASDMTRNLDDDEKGTQIVRTLGGNQTMTIISESGLYHAAIKSRKQEAQKFRKWVTSEVLPSIRKTGGYTVPRTYAEALQVAADQAKLIERQKKQIEQMKPDAQSWETYAGNMEQRESEKSFREVAKLLQLGIQRSLPQYLFLHGYILREKGRWVASQKGLISGMLVNRIVTVGEWSGEQCKVTAYGMQKLAEWKSDGKLDLWFVKERTYGERRRSSDYRTNKKPI